ncbi:MAG: toprim domain-containing protein, partial [Opitutus sp.]
ETEQLGFTEAVEALGKRFGILIEYEEGSGGPTTAERSLRQEIFDLHEQAAEHFHQAFKAQDETGEFFRRYWQEQRRFPLELAAEFKIGAADGQGGGLGAVLLRKKYSEEALRRCGLFFIHEGAALTAQSLRARFRGRLMIPIRDHQGRVVAFTARQSERTPDDDPAREAKYVNSPETPIFTKGNLLFNLDRARTAVGEGRPFVLVEGQLDALRCWSVGLKTAIAPQGTSITEPQLLLLRRYHPEVECFLDSDEAGQKAALRFLPMALKAGLEVRFLTLAGAEKLDPDLLFLERGLTGYAELRKGARSAMAFACAAVLPDPGKASAEERSRAAQGVVELIAASESDATRASLLQEAAPRLWLQPKTLETEFNALLARQGRQAANRQAASAAPSIPPAPSLPAQTPEHHLLMLSLHFESVRKPLSQLLPHAWIDTTHPAGVLLNRLLAEFEHNAWPGRDNLDDLLESAEERTLVAALLFETPAIDFPMKVAQEGLQQLRQRALEPRLRQIELALANPRADIDADPISLLKERSELHRQLRQPLVLAAAV